MIGPHSRNGAGSATALPALLFCGSPATSARDRGERSAHRSAVDRGKTGEHDVETTLDILGRQRSTSHDLVEDDRADDDARQQYVDILELMGPDDPRTAKYRKLLTQRLF